jgi:tetratricopeptide (TPR) repeat protein
MKTNMSESDDALLNAVGFHQGGNLAEAWRLYQQILAREPGHAPTLNCAGLLLRQTGQFEQALDYLRRAIAGRATEAAYHANLGEAYRGLGKLHQGIDCYLEAVRLAPQEFATHFYLATLYEQAQMPAEAAASFQRALDLRPDVAAAHHGLGRVHRAAGRLAEAAASLRKAAELAPGDETVRSDLQGVEQSLQGSEPS